MKSFSLVVAASKNLGIGLHGDLLKRIPADMKHFQRVTTAGTATNTVIMGRRTWESLPPKAKPLPNRRNVVVTSGSIGEEGALACASLRDALEAGENHIFVIGGERLFREALSEDLVNSCRHIYLTRIAVELEADVFLPAQTKHLYAPNPFGPRFTLTQVSKTYSIDGVPYDFTVYTNVNCAEPPLVSFPPHEEYQYLDLIRTILAAEERADRTKVGTFSLFGAQQRWDLSQSFPLLTTKAVFWKGVVQELLWFIRGDTNAKHLSAQGVTIWDANGSREFLDSRGLTAREEGDLGPVYGFQWRHFGARYETCHSDYSGQGVDQLKEVIHLIKTDPTSRRIVLSAWNPAALDDMALPPCHVMSQFYVSGDRLSCLMFQRSCDMGLGVPFNIASYSLLTCLLAQVTGLKPGEFIHTLGDAHVYKSHVEGLTEQLQRHPHTFPVLQLNPDIRDIDAFTPADLTLVGYNAHPRIRMEMAV
jgi:dihydrofolate reductase/thymidylate synthase